MDFSADPDDERIEDSFIPPPQAAQLLYISASSRGTKRGGDDPDMINQKSARLQDLVCGHFYLSNVRDR